MTQLLLTNIRSIGTEIPQSIILFQNYPNPFNPNTNIKFSINVNTHVILKVYNLLGAEVAILANDVLKSGTYEVTFYGENLPSGVYYYRLEVEDPTGRTGEFTDTKRMVILK